MLSQDLMYPLQSGPLLALTPASHDYNQAWLAGDNMIWLVYFLAAPVQLQWMFVCWRCNAMPIMGSSNVSEIYICGQIVWLHSSMLSAGQTRRNPQYRPEHTPGGTSEGQSEAKWTTRKERERERNRKQRGDGGQNRLQSITIFRVIKAVISRSLT